MNTIKISKTTVLLVVAMLITCIITLSGCGSTDTQPDMETVNVETDTINSEQNINIECTVLDVRESFIPTDCTMYHISIILEDTTGCRMAVNYRTRYLYRTYKTRQVDEKSTDTYSKLKLLVPGDKVIYHGNYDFELINNNENTVAE